MVDIKDIKDKFPQADGWHALYSVTEPSSNLNAYIAIHSVKRGPSFGGIRRMKYASAVDAVADACRLSSHMSLKTELAELNCGGAKTVICEVPGLDVEAGYRALGHAIQQLDGSYYCGPDVGTGEREMAYVRERTRYANLTENKPSESTAAGVMAGIRALTQFVDMPLESVTVQGVGRVGAIVARGVAAQGARVTVSDLSKRSIDNVVAAINAEVVTPENALSYESTLLSPCAVGPVVTVDNADRLPFNMICGSANNQLATDELAERLHERGILYAPDIVVNAGAVIEGVLTLLEDGSDVRQRVADSIDAIEGRLFDMLCESKTRMCSPLRVALSRRTTL